MVPVSEGPGGWGVKLRFAAVLSLCSVSRSDATSDIFKAPCEAGSETRRESSIQRSTDSNSLSNTSIRTLNLTAAGIEVNINLTRIVPDIPSSTRGNDISSASSASNEMGNISTIDSTCSDKRKSLHENERDTSDGKSNLTSNDINTGTSGNNGVYTIASRANSGVHNASGGIEVDTTTANNKTKDATKLRGKKQKRKGKHK